MTSEYNLALNFNNNIPIKTDMTFKQGDKGITLNLATSGLDTTGTTAHIVFKRSNGTSVEAELTGQSGPTYGYTILGNEFEVPGVVVADLKLYNGDTQRVSTASFIFQVTGDTLDGIGGGTGGYSDQLKQLSQEFEDTLTQYEEAFSDVGAVHAAGNYDPTTEYSPLDLVYYSTDNSTYLCVEGCTGETPSPSSQYWQLVVDGSSMSTPNLDDLADVSAASPSDGDVLTYDDNSGDWIAAALPAPPTVPKDLNDLDDVDAASPTSGQILKYNGTSENWEAANDAGGTNPNLLFNPWFTVNQRTTTSGTIVHNAYIVDRWKTSYGSAAGTWEITASGLKLTAAAGTYAQITQVLENPSDFDGKQVTLSALLSDGTIYSYSFTRVDGTEQTKEFGNFRIRWHSNGAILFFALNGSSYTIRAVKLEIGPTSTLHLDIAPDYSTELLKCQRYFVRWKANQYGRFCIGIMETATTTRIIRFLPVPMRIVPTITSSGSFTVYQPGSSSSVVSSMQIITSSSSQDVSIEVTTSSSLTQGVTVTVAATSSGGSYFDFNAEL